MKIRSIQKVILYSLLVIILGACAKMVTPTGGPKDEQHPLIVEIEPPDYSINFDSKNISISFDEYIQLLELNNNLIISPPVEENPEIKIKGKTLHINFEEELKDSTTYNIYFGNSVRDYNEGNPIENFQYVLSTGSFIDSLSIQGQVLNSFNLLPEEGVFVMLYTDHEDSIPIKEIPIYISKTNKEGFFKINNIKNDQFKLFCLRDFNKNYLFDIVDENIAFIDSLVVFDLITETSIDTVFKSDSSINLKSEEILEIDSIIIKSDTYFKVNNYILKLFAEDGEVQYLANNTRDTKQKVEIMFNQPIKDSVILSIADTIIKNDWYIKETGINEDSLIYWLSDSTIYNKETITFLLTYQKEDSNLVYQWNTDTLNLRYFEKAQNQKENKKNQEEADTSLKYNLNIKSRGTVDLNSKLNFEFETPLQNLDTSKIELFSIVDSLDIPVNYNILKDSIKLRKYFMAVDWCEDAIYKLKIYPDAFVDIYETVNDTSILEFKTQKLDFYGKILADITGIDSSFQVICQLILPGKEEELIYRYKIIKSDQIIEYDFLPPKEFIFKIIIDKNFNKKWDTGEYLKHLSPEEVLYHEDKITVRSNWDIEINFNVNK
ncbi:MAG: Ig-like domain-containing protein [Bacteroidales bacterium]|jgi:hypothetical protein|nr:Ig-like domain-containing protein [Bacteroidales bacterium]